MAKINILENKNNHWQLELPSEIHKPLHHPENIFNYQQEQCFEKLEDFLTFISEDIH